MPRILTNFNTAEPDTVLTDHMSKPFRCLFSSEIEEEYNFSTIHKSIYSGKGKGKCREYNDGEKLILFNSLCSFLDKAFHMTYTELFDEHLRPRDANDIAHDEEDDHGFPIDHLSIDNSGIAGHTRIHGYMREGVFVIKRIDWAHRFHGRQNLS